MKQKMNVWSKTLFIFLLMNTPAWALPGFYFDLNAFAGYSSPMVNPEAKADPDMGSFGGGVTLGWKILPIAFFGVSSDYRFMNQYSAVDSTVGNFAGSRWNQASPTLGLMLGGLVIKVDAQILGSYELRNKSTNNETVMYESPLGGRVSVLLPQGLLVSWPVQLGAYYEQVYFSKVHGSVLGTSELSNKVTITQAGLVAAFVF